MLDVPYSQESVKFGQGSEIQDCSLKRNKHAQGNSDDLPNSMSANMFYEHSLILTETIYSHTIRGDFLKSSAPFNSNRKTVRFYEIFNSEPQPEILQSNESLKNR